jgi:hypothetical protein
VLCNFDCHAPVLLFIEWYSFHLQERQPLLGESSTILDVVYTQFLVRSLICRNKVGVGLGVVSMGC